MKITCVIPARYASTRLPGKPLRDIAGKQMVVRVYERARKARRIDTVIVATDDERIKKVVEDAGGSAMMTSSDHQTGTDRLAEVAAALEGVDVIINVQGDEPLIEPAIIDELAELFVADSELQMATVRTPLTDEAAIDNPNNVKVVTDRSGNALYFSRSRIPFARNGGWTVYQHIGIYAYRRDFLLEYASMPQTPLELSESLEQLRALENGYTIRVITAEKAFIGVDTEEDLARINEIFDRMNED